MKVEINTELIDARKVDELGRVVIPIEIRRELNINEKDLLIIHQSGTKIIIEKFMSDVSCVICRKENAKGQHFEKSFICTDCLKIIKNQK